MNIYETIALYIATTLIVVVAGIIALVTKQYNK